MTGAGAEHRYLLALGSNMRHPRHGAPRQVIAEAFQALGRAGFPLIAVSRIVESAPLGPSRRRYANAAALVHSRRDPHDVLHDLQEIEYGLGRRRTGQRWGARVLDLDIVLWSGGAYAAHDGAAALTIPHASFRERRFVLDPAAMIAGDWRDPLTGLSIRHLRTRLTKPRHPPT